MAIWLIWFGRYFQYIKTYRTYLWSDYFILCNQVFICSTFSTTTKLPLCTIFLKLHSGLQINERIFCLSHEYVIFSNYAWCTAQHGIKNVRVTRKAIPFHSLAQSVPKVLSIYEQKPQQKFLRNTCVPTFNCVNVFKLKACWENDVKITKTELNTSTWLFK